MVYNLDGKVNVPSPTKARQMLAVFVTKVKGWQDTVAWFTQLIDSMWGQDADRKVDFEETSSIVRAVGEKYGQFNDGECLKMKTELLTSESRKPGRIRLVDFYKKSIFGAWDFSEKIDYLRVLGALDESDPATPLVIVPNYVASRPQCLTSSNYYSVCCRDECEDLVGVLERNIAAPQADTVQVVKIVESMASSTRCASCTPTSPSTSPSPTAPSASRSATSLARRSSAWSTPSKTPPSRGAKTSRTRLSSRATTSTPSRARAR